jgi:uncharacterized ferritin-like protein (DUF455 family)
MDIETWAAEYIAATTLDHKRAPPPCPSDFGVYAPRRIDAPGRPPELRAAKRGDRLPKPEALREAKYRAKVLHTFWHHELQAAELMCWAILAFSDAEPEFRRGLLRICLDEIRHMRGYEAHIASLGFAIGDFPIRDWFWTRVPACRTKTSFVAVMGMGLEAANLEHAPSFAERFRAFGDERGARVQDEIAKDELQHVAFAVRWFETWTGRVDFDEWIAALPLPWSPYVLRGTPLQKALRAKAGMPQAFIAALDAYVPEKKGRA